MKALLRQGSLTEEPSGIPYLADPDRDMARAPLQASTFKLPVLERQ